MGFIDELKQPSFWFSGLCEFLGVMFLILLACGSCYPYDNVRISLTFGFTIAAMVWVTAHVSGGHLNPAVSTGFFVTRKISVLKFINYVVCQVGGALIGALILKGVAAWSVKGVKNTLCTSTPNMYMSQAQTFGVEFLITFVLVWTVLASVDPGRDMMSGSRPLAIGLAVAIGNFWAAPLTGAGINPARVFGPAVVSDSWKYHWCYWIGPLLAGALAALLYEFVFACNASLEKFKGFVTKLDYRSEDYGKEGSETGGSKAGSVGERTPLLGSKEHSGRQYNQATSEHSDQEQPDA